MLLYTNNHRIPENQWFPIHELDTLRVEWKPLNRYVTLIIYDIDAPSSMNPSSSPFLHQLVININGNNIRSGNVVMPYTPPAPPAHSGDHRYIVALYTQNNIITAPLNNIERSGNIINEKVFQRERFNVDSFVQRNRLTLVDHDTIVVDPETMMFYVEPIQITVNPAHPLILGNSTLSEKERNYCSCLIDVSSKLPIECIKKGEAFTYEHGKMCYNPFAVCAKSVGTTSRECAQNYNFNAMDDTQIEAFAALHNVSLAYPVNREELFEMFATRK